MRRAAPVALGLGALALYLASLSQWYSADSLGFLNEIEVGGEWAWLDPYHALLNPLSALCIVLGRAVGSSGIEAVQILNAVGGALSVALVFVLAARLSGDRRAAALASAGCAVSGAMWLLSTEAEGVTPGLAANLAVLVLCLDLAPGEPRSPRQAVRLGAAVGGAAAFYLTGSLLLLLPSLSLWQGRRENPGWARSLACLAAGFAAVVVPLLAVIMLQQRFSEFDYGPFGLYLGGSRYGSVSWQNLPRGAYAFLRTLVLFPELGINDRTMVLLSSADRPTLLAWGATYVGAAAVVLAMLLQFWKGRAAIAAHLRARLLLWAAAFAAFALWWVPSDISFWAPLAAGWWIATAVVLAQHPAARRLAPLGIAALLVVNGVGLIWPHHDAERNEPLQTALALAPQLAPRDRLLTSPPLSAFVRYFARRESVPIAGDGALAAELARARREVAKDGGRVLLVDLPLEDARRAGATPVAAFEANGMQVWELR